MDSILTSVKKMLGIAEEYEHFDTDIIMHINSVFMTLTQLGVGPSEGFTIADEDAIWADFIPDTNRLQAVKTYMYLRVRLLFDPASLGSATLAAYERQIQEFEWRMHIDGESQPKNDEDTGTVTKPTIEAYGVVVDCLKLNVRATPSNSAAVVHVLEVNTKINVDIAKSVDDWYYVYADDGVAGYCLKTNIRIYI